VSEVTLYAGLASSAAHDEFLSRFATTKASLLVSSSPALIRYGHDFLNGKYAHMYDLEQIEIWSDSQIVQHMAALCELPHLRIINSDYQATIASIEFAKLPPESVFYEIRNVPGLHNVFVELMQELRRFRIPDEAVAELGPRAAEITSLASDIRDAMAARQLTTRSQRIEQIIETTPKSQQGVKHLFWFGQREWMPIDIALAKWIYESGVSLHLFVESHPANPQFYPSFARLQQEFPTANVVSIAPFQPAANGLYGDDADHVPNIELYSAADEFIETEWIVHSILTTLEEGRLKPNEIGIFVRVPDFYVPLLRSAGARFGIEFAGEWKDPVMTNPFAQILWQVLDAAAQHTPADLAPLVSDPYFDLQGAEADVVAETIREAALQPDGWVRLAKHPSAPPSIKVIAQLASAAHAGDRQIADWIRWLNEFTAKTSFLSRSLHSGQEVASRDEAARDAMVRWLEMKRLAVPQNARMRLREFVRFAKDAWQDAKYTVRKKGQIDIVSDLFAIGNKRLVFAPGLVEGRFPKRRAEEPLLLDSDRMRLRQHNDAHLLLTSYERAEEERREFHRLVSAAPELVLTWPEFIRDHQEFESHFIVDLRMRFPNLSTHRKRIEDRAVAAAASPEQIEQIETVMSRVNSEQIEDEALRTELSRIPNPLSLSHIRALRRCKFQYLCRAKFKLRPRRPRWVFERIADIIRQADLVNAKGLDAIRDALEKSLNAYVTQMEKQCEAGEVVLLRHVAPTVLESFAVREDAARKLWDLTPAGQQCELAMPHFRTKLKFRQGFIELEDRIDLLYFSGKNNNPMPIRIAWASEPSSKDEEFLFEAGLIATLAQAESIQLAGIESLENDLRRAIAGSNDPKQRLASDPQHRLFVDVKFSGPHLQQKAKDTIQEFDLKAASAEFTPVPGPHCTRCGFASLCRRAQDSQFFEPENVA